MKNLSILTAISLLTTSCATLNDSLELGAGMGAIAGGAATYSAYSSTGRQPTVENVAVGAGIGIGLGLITSYFTHTKLASDRQAYQSDQTEMHFGDLPPSPFILPQVSTKKVGR